MLDREPEDGRPDPLEVAPVLWPVSRPVWDAFQFVMTWADGFGGVHLADLDRYFQPPHKGSRLEPELRQLVQKLVPQLLNHHRELESEKRRRQMAIAAAKNPRR